MDFRQWLEGADELEDFYRDNEKKVLEDPEVNYPPPKGSGLQVS